MPIKFKIDPDDLTWEELETLQDCAVGHVEFRRLRELLARFMVDETGQAVEASIAKAQLGKLRRSEIIETFGRINEAIMVPPANGGG